MCYDMDYCSVCDQAEYINYCVENYPKLFEEEEEELSEEEVEIRALEFRKDQEFFFMESYID